MPTDINRYEKPGFVLFVGPIWPTLPQIGYFLHRLIKLQTKIMDLKEEIITFYFKIIRHNDAAGFFFPN